jgi:hypothetical protein
MNSRTFDGLLGLAAFALASTAVWRVAGATGAPLGIAPVAVGARGGAVADSDAVTDAMDAVLDANPFRFSRSTPAIVSAATPAQPAAATGPRTPPTVKAILGGPPWQAVLSGVPGQPGEVVVLTGMRFGGILITSIMRDTVVVQVSDTTFRLTMKREYQ